PNNTPAKEYEPVLSPTGTQIAFTSWRNATNTNIWLMKTDGTGLTQVTTHASFDHSPVWSPDGTRLAFVSDRGGVERVYVINASTTEAQTQPTLIATGRDPAWSPDGTALAISAINTATDNTYDLYIVDMTNNSYPRYQWLGESLRAEMQPTWSPDSSAVVFTSIIYSGGIPNFTLKRVLRYPPFTVAEVSVVKDAGSADYSPGGNELIWRLTYSTTSAGFSRAAATPPFGVTHYPVFNSNGNTFNPDWGNFQIAAQPTATPPPGSPITYRYQAEDADQWYDIGGHLWPNPSHFYFTLLPGEWLLYRNMDLGSGLLGFSMFGGASLAAHQIQVRLDSPTGHTACTLSVATTTWIHVQQNASCDGSTGMHDLYITVSGPTGQNNGIEIDWIELQFANGGTTPLSRYGVVTARTWDPNELSQIQLAVEYTAQAFFRHYNDAITAQQTSPLAVFKRVFYTSNRNRITFDRLGGSDAYCVTNKNSADPDLARITCSGTNLALSAETIVHELGHAFVGRTALGNPSFLARIENPVADPTDTSGQLRDSNNQFVIGRRTVNFNGDPYPDWARSQRFTIPANIDNGWGSAAAFPGRCDGRAGHTFNAAAPPRFQQNACDIQPWLYSQAPYNDPNLTRIQDVEVEEAAADMFLNWVYRRTTAGTLIGVWQGFQNRLWENDYNGNPCPASSGCSDPGNSGDARYFHMNRVMRELQLQFGW
ncbi:MAG: carbohydrate-binding protein, partial [Chloroflexota bacterium]|nr:carbohydrate-binding protein [Chloroflexota bacterium]